MGWDDVPRFGSLLPGLPLVVRPSVYGLIANSEQRVAVVREPDGVFLPGGGIDEGESPEDALVREAAEECGWLVRIGALRDRAVQLALAGDGSAFYEKRSEFYEISVERESGEPMEANHETLWVTGAEARTLLTHESHAWAVERFLSARGPQLPEAIPSRIAGFHQDAEGHWVADLECGHTQHVRHDPPWQNRPWVTTEEGRTGFIGVELLCSRCRDESTSV